MPQEISHEVFHGDCLEILGRLEQGSVDLVYLDPPFFTQKKHALRTRDRRTEFSFDDVWGSHVEYGGFLHERLQKVSVVLKDTGSVFFHCDRQASHIVRTLLDDVFGSENFRAEIIWYYRRWSNAQRNLLPAHQTVFFYSKSSAYKFNPLYQEYSPSTNVDQILQRRKRDKYGKAVYDRDNDGTIRSNGAKRGVPLADVWDIPYLNPKAKERVGYPTQKPILLLERVVNLATSPGDVVLDPFCGSGTTLVAAKLLGRSAIGIDSSLEAVELAKRRLSDPVKTESTLLSKGRESYRQADEAALRLLGDLDFVPVHRNKGIDAILIEPYKGRPVPVRVQRSNEPMIDAARALLKASRSKHAKLMILVVTEREPESHFELIPDNILLLQSPSCQFVGLLADIYTD